MQIRRLGTEDMASLLKLYDHLHSSDDPLPPSNVVEAVWEELTSSKHFYCFGGFVSSALICSCAFSIIPNLTRGCCPYGIIENVVTDPAQRKQGHGVNLLKHVLSQAWAMNCYKVMLLTGRKDNDINRFYKAAGFNADEKKAFVARP